MAYTEEQEKHDVCLNLSINSQKSNIFVPDLTPTPTRLIKNCEEIGLFDDLLRHANPFDETFRRAIEQNYDESSAVRHTDNLEQPAEELHTPQVFPQLDTTSSSYTNHITCSEENAIPAANCVTLDVPCLPCTEVTFTDKVVEKSQVAASEDIISSITAAPTQPTTIIQLVQPQVVTWKINEAPTTDATKLKSIRKPAHKVPIKSIKSYILPKPASAAPASNIKLDTVVPHETINVVPHEPSSASLTPTSQLPIKERLKAILSNSSKARSFEQTKSQSEIKKDFPKSTNNSDDTLERKRAASSRYRNKVRYEQSKLRHENKELKSANKKLLDRIANLERELETQRATIQQLQSLKDVAVLDNCQLKIPPSSLNLVINVPGMVVPMNNQPPQLQNSITYRIEKR